MALQAQFMLMPTTTNVYNDQQGEQQQQMLQRAMLSGPDSRLTYYTSASRKRFRDDEMMMMMLQPSFHQKAIDRSSRSAGTSTSGGPISQGMEIDALIRLHNAKLRAGLDEIANKHCKQLLSMMETQAIKKLSHKEMEIAAAKRRQAELEEKLGQLTSENQIWFNVVKNSEAAIAGLKANLDQVLQQQNGDRHVAVEGVGDAESCCNNGGEEEEGRMRRLCKVCGHKDVSVLVLPCRHLCLCRDCEAGTGTCPICDVPKNAGMQVVLG